MWHSRNLVRIGLSSYKCVLLYGFCSNIHGSGRRNTGCTITHCRKSLVYEVHAHPQWGMLYILFTIITKGNNQLCLWTGGKELSWGVEKQVYTLLIWTLLLVLSLSTLSRASKPGIGMNSILRTCKFINSCVYSRSTRNCIYMLVPVPYGPWELH